MSNSDNNSEDECVLDFISKHSEDLIRNEESKELCEVKSIPDRHASSLKFSIDSILGYGNKQSRPSSIASCRISFKPTESLTPGSGIDSTFKLMENYPEEECDSSCSPVTDDDGCRSMMESDDEMVMMKKVEEEESFCVIPSSQRLSWLQCTRYKPPKLPRTKKSKEGSKKRKLGRNPRVPFTQHQVAVLEKKFYHTHYLSSVDVAELSATLNLTENRVKIWFQNRRARERREKDSLSSPPTGCPLSSAARNMDNTSSSFLGTVTNETERKSISNVKVPSPHPSIVNNNNNKTNTQSLTGFMTSLIKSRDCINLASERFDLLPSYFSTAAAAVPSSSLAIFDNRMMASYSWPTSVQGLCMPMAAASAPDIFAQLSSSVMHRRLASTFGPISFLR